MDATGNPVTDVTSTYAAQSAYQTTAATVRQMRAAAVLVCPPSATPHWTIASATAHRTPPNERDGVQEPGA